jgi:uncharacterized protein YndB with AHSA1/START domain
MIGTPQGSDEIVIEASPERIWALLEDSSRLPEWAPMVRTTTGTIEALGTRRHCEVEFEGRRGRVSEECVLYDRLRRIGWRMVADTLGFGRMLRGMGFDFVLVPEGLTTRVVNTTYFEPAGLLGRVMALLALRRGFRRVRRRVLLNVKRLAEAEEARPGSPAPVMREARI